MEAERKPNRLIHEKSPYLLQHAYNPVDWYAWGDEALSKSKNDGKPIFLSIGYSTCHWCHVLAHESFEDEKTAALINKNFIPIKVDREERPELDAYYMTAVQSMTGQGGWPLSVFLTPDLKPFYGGTYFPPEPRYGMPSFTQVLEFVANVWKDSKREVIKNSEQIAASIQKSYQQTAKGGLSEKLLEEGYAALVASFDPEHGGFGGPPKFPLPLYMSYLLRFHYRTGKEMALKSVVKTLEEIAKGGIHDHLGGGFHRYATDRVWLVPHFEKMLYDNALLAKVFAEAYAVTRNRYFYSAARDTLAWLEAEMMDPQGAFYSGQDADTTDGEGAYYTWTPEEVEKVLGREDGNVFSFIYGVTQNGNFEGSRTILRVVNFPEQAAEKFGLTPQEVAVKVENWKKALYKTKLQRPRPATDKKILTAWNGLAVSALCAAGTIFGSTDFLAEASRAAEFVEKVLVKEGRILRRFADGEAAIDGTLEDYAFFVQGLLDLFEAKGATKWLELSITLNGSMVEQFWDSEGGGFFMNDGGAPARIKDGYDGPTPSGNSVAATNLLRLAEITGDAGYREKAGRVLEVFHGDLEEQPSAHTNMLAALDLYLKGMREVVITGPSPAEVAPFVAEFGRRFMPDKVMVVATGQNAETLGRLTPLLEGRGTKAPPTVYICQNFACRRPITDLAELKKELGDVS